MRLRHLDTFRLLWRSRVFCLFVLGFFVPFPGKSEECWKKQEGLDGENIWAGSLLGEHCVFKRRFSSNCIRTPIICGCPVREAQKSERRLLLLLPPPPLSLPLSLSLSFPISLYYRRHLQPFYAGRSQSCRERCSPATCAQPAAGQADGQLRPRW